MVITKKSIILSVGGILAVGVLGVASYLLYSGISEFARTQDSLRNTKMELERYYAQDPFPSPANVAIEARNVASQEDWFTRIMASLRRGQITSSDRSPSIFIRTLDKSKPRLRACAETNGVELAEGCEFGFARYFAGGERPGPDDVPRLTEQMAIVEELVTVLFEEKVSRLERVQREEFEGAVTVKTRPVAGGGLRPVRPGAGLRKPRPSRSGKGGQGALSARPGTGIIEKGALFGRYHFVLEFQAAESTVWRVLNRYASHELFVITTGVWLHKGHEDVKASPPAAPQGDSETPVLGAGAYKRERLVSGPQLEQPMSVTIELDVYKFKETENSG